MKLLVLTDESTAADALALQIADAPDALRARLGRLPAGWITREKAAPLYDVRGTHEKGTG